MKTLRILMLALLLPTFVMTGCTTGGGDNPGDAQIELPNNSEKTQTAFADDETTGGFTFTAKQAWTATVTESGATRVNLSGGSATRASNVPWLRLLFDGRETYEGGAGKFTLVIELDENYSGETRTATITIKSGADTITITVTQEGKKEDGTIPVEPGKPVPDGMRYVSRMDFDYGDGDGQTSVFEYDSKNRVIKVSSDYSYPDVDDDVVAFSYDDANRTVTMTLDDEEDVYVFRLNTDGAVVSSEWTSDDVVEKGALTYTDGYLGKFVYGSGSAQWGDEIFTMTWSGGNKTRMVHEEDGYDPYVTDLSYNTSWANNPLCNLDLNALIAPFDDGIYSDEGTLVALDLFGKRSKNMISGIKNSRNSTVERTSEITVEYDTDGFVKKITVVDNYVDGNGETHNSTAVCTITYR